MEFEFSSTLAIISFLTCLFMIAKLLAKKSVKNRSPLHLIPGPKRLPVIGNLHQLISDKSPPHQTFRNLAAKHGPLMHLQLGEVPFVIVSSVEIAKQVVKTHDITFANRPPGNVATPITYNYTNIGYAPYGEYWRHLRRICTHELMSAKRVKSFRHVREEENLSLAKWIASNEGSPVNMSERLYLSSFDVTTRATIGGKTEERGTIVGAIKDVPRLASGLGIADLFPSIKFLSVINGSRAKIDRIFKRSDRILESVIDEHKAAKGSKTVEDLVDVLLKYQQDDELPLTNDNIKAVLMDLFSAGGETSGNVVDWAMSEMTKNPSTMKKAQEEVRQVFDGKGYVDEAEFDELKYLKLVIKETLRLHPPFPLLIPRYNSDKCEVNGYEIPAKTRVFINAYALGRDPKYWNDAEKFMPERFKDSSIDYKGTNLEYIPFGAGRRTCPGVIFGLADVEYTLAMLLYHFDWKMPNGIKNEELDMTEESGLTVKRKHDLHLIPTVSRPLKLAVN